MPYYVHERGIKTDQEQVARVAMFTKQDAVAALQAGESVSFIANAAEHQAWRDREYRRLYGDANGQREYLPLPFATPWEHYAHRAEGDPEKVSYTPDSQYGHEDRRLVTTPIRYLEKYAELINYSRGQFQELAGKMRAGAMALRYAETAEDIVRVYHGGPGSCMDGAPDHFPDPADNPTRAYAGGDLVCAYLGDIDKASARAMVWRERKLYVRAYGDLDAMHAALKSEGYSKVSSWDGARLRAIEHDSYHWIVPYIDGGIQQLGHEGEWLIVGRGQISGTNTCGYSRMVSAHNCQHCSDSCEQGEDYCESCRDNSFTCYECNDLEFGDYYTLGDESYCGACYRAQRRRCEHCSTRFDSVGAEDESGEYCDDCYSEMTSCEHCDTRGHSDDLQLADHGDHENTCIDCRRDMSRRRVRPLHATWHNGTVTQSASTRWDSLIAWAERRY